MWYIISLLVGVFFGWLACSLSIAAGSNNADKYEDELLNKLKDCNKYLCYKCKVSAYDVGLTDCDNCPWEIDSEMSYYNK